jgi:hypothetical protein
LTFEEALRAELITITLLNNKVYPLVAPKGETVPFLVYKKNNIKFYKTLDGIHRKVEAVYVITIITSTYAELQTLSLSVTDLLISFLGRKLSTSDISIKNIEVENIGDQYESEVDFYRNDIRITVNY